MAAKNKTTFLTQLTMVAERVTRAKKDRGCVCEPGRRPNSAALRKRARPACRRRDRMKGRPFTRCLGGATAAWWLNSALLLLGFAVSWPSAIKAHDIYATLKNSAGRSCCNDHDCRPAHYRVSAAGVQMLVSGEWILLPNWAIQYRTLEGDTGETAGGHWCGLSGGFVTVTYCAVLPPNSASSTVLENSRSSRWK